MRRQGMYCSPFLQHPHMRRKRHFHNPPVIIVPHAKVDQLTSSVCKSSHMAPNEQTGETDHPFIGVSQTTSECFFIFVLLSFASKLV